MKEKNEISTGERLLSAKEKIDISDSERLLSIAKAAHYLGIPTCQTDLDEMLQGYGF
jgi:glutaredoxin-related protein